MATSTQLLGPPNLAGKPLNSSLENHPTPEITHMETIISQTTDFTLTGKPPMGLTENLSHTFLSSGNPCLDFFFHIVPDTPPDDLIQRLQLAWAFDSLTTLKLICNLRGVRGTGKSDKEGFYTASLWLHKHHPKTLALNTRFFAGFGYLKDLPEILYRILEGPEVRKIAKEEWRNRKRGKRFSRKKRIRGKSGKEKEGILENLEEKEICAVGKEKARVLRKEREFSKAKIALERYNTDSDYRYLYDCICGVFADLLKLDLKYLNSGEVFKISLAAKWCPSIDSSFDKATLICEGIARRVFPRECDAEYEGIEEAHYVYRVRDRLRKQVLVPLHKVLDLPEVYMSANQWNSLLYNRVASVAMKTYKGLFLKHDKERFEEYLEKVKSGNAKIAAGALLPHEIIKSLDDEDGGKVAELQWARVVEDLAKKGKLNNCIAVCDVSGSMRGTPMDVSVALGLLVSELSEDPWKGKVITFSENPQLHVIEGDSLLSKSRFIKEMEWGYNTDFQQVFDQILQVAVEGNLSQDQIIKRIFVFSDMEFDEASGSNQRFDYTETEDDEVSQNENMKNTWETDYEVIQRKFREKGYNRVPEIVFWNLRDSSSTPVVARQSGVALVSGFSKNLLTLFLEEGGIVNPENVMELAISGEEYKKLVVYD